MRANSMRDAIQKIIARISPHELPADPQTISRAVHREEAMTTYLGKGRAIPHARLDGIETPVVVFARSDEGVPLETANDRTVNDACEVGSVLPSRSTRRSPKTWR